MNKSEKRKKEKKPGLVAKFKEASKIKRAAIIVVAAVLLAIIALAVILLMPVNTSDDSTTETATTMTITKSISSDGEVKSSSEEDLTPHTSYYLKKINVEEGDALAEGETILTYTNGSVMKAPYDCVVQNWSLPDLGDQLTSDHYVNVAGTDVFQVELTVGEDEVGLVSVGDTASVEVEAVSGTYTGEVSYVSQVGSYNNGSSSFTVKINFDNDGKIKLGMSASVEIILEEAKNVVGIPIDALHASGDGYYVTIIDGRSEKDVSVEIGIKNDSYVEITSGISAGDEIVVPVSDEDSNSFGGFGGFGGGDMPSMGGQMGGSNMGESSRGGGNMQPPNGGSK